MWSGGLSLLAWWLKQTVNHHLFDANMFCGLYFAEEFEDFITSTEVYQHMPFNFKCEFMETHFGKTRQREIGYMDFTQLLHVSRK